MRSHSTPIPLMGWDGFVHDFLEDLLGVEERNDYVKHAKESADAHLAKYPAMRASLEASQSPGTQSKVLDAFRGKYYNPLGDLHI